MLSESIYRIVEREFPQVHLSPVAGFWPVPARTQGELSSRAAIEIARATKQNAAQIAERLIERMSAELSAQWRNDQGYIVCWQMSRDVLFAEVDADVQAALARLDPLRQTSVRRVWCLLPDSVSPVYARIRLAARAALQAVLTVVYEGVCDVRMHPCCARKASSIGAVVESFKEAVEWILSHEGESRADPQILCEAGELPDSSSVWTTHHYHDRCPPALRRALATARTSGRVTLVMPADGWLLSRDRALSEILQSKALTKVVSRLNTPDGWYRFMMHAAASVPSGDFDPAVALFEESASPLWNLRALVERYRRFGETCTLPLAKDTAAMHIESLPEPRELVVKPLLMPAYCARAIAHAEVAEWCEAIELMAQRSHAFINAPATRLALERKVSDSNTGKIAAGLGFGLSCILPVVVEDACEDR